MTAHSSGTGGSWNETLDVDQPHGLDYQEWNDIRIGIRKRESQEHNTYADNTVGGIHKPGGAAVLGIDDDTATVIADGTYRGHGLVWDGSVNLWCWTQTAGITDTPGVAGTEDWTILKMHPDKQWGGQDVTWAGAHEFDASVDFTGNIGGDITFHGALEFDGTVDFTAGVNIDGTAEVLNELACASDVIIAGDLVADGTAVFTSEVDISGNCDISGTLNLFKHTADTSGYCYLPGGIIFQWGSDLTLTANTARDITFSIAFPSAVWSVVPSFSDDVTTFNRTNTGLTVAAKGTEKFTLINIEDISATGDYMAIGN